MLVFEERGNRNTRRKPPVHSREPTNSTHMTPSLGIEPGPHWWETSALTTAPSLHPQMVMPNGNAVWEDFTIPFFKKDNLS